MMRNAWTPKQTLSDSNTTGTRQVVSMRYRQNWYKFWQPRQLKLLVTKHGSTISRVDIYEGER